MKSAPPPKDQTDQPRRVLLVDDSVEYRRILERMLRIDHGIVVLEAASGIAALTLLERERVDLVVADLVMPGLPGDELLEVVGRRWPGTRRVLLTSWSTAELVLSSAYEVLDKGLAGWLLTDRIACLAAGAL
jgi:CheY-like chemotaxis protein